MTFSCQTHAFSRTARRYRVCGQYAYRYVASKLRLDPIYRDLMARGGEFGHVVDIGCGRGQLAALLLETGMATRVTGLDWNRTHLDQAKAALSGLRFEGHVRDLANDQSVPDADTIMTIDVLYQLTSAVQYRLLDASGRAARSQWLVRTLDSGLGARSTLAMAVERLTRRFLPSSGTLVNPLKVSDIGARIMEAGFAVETAPSFHGTPFANVLLLGRRREVRS